VQVYIDFIRATGLYEAAATASWMEANAPTSMLTAPGYLRSFGFNLLANKRRLYHVEGQRFLTGESFRDAGIGDLDTVVVVNSDALIYESGSSIDKLHDASVSDRKGPSPGWKSAPVASRAS